MLSDGLSMPEVAHDPFDAMCEALSIPMRGMVAVLIAYIDESYNQRTGKNLNDPLVYTVACYVSTRQRWSTFGKQWKSALKSKGLDHFHMNKFENRIGEYQDWGESERHNFFRRLKRIIKDNTIYGASISVNCAEYDALLQGEIRTEWGKTHYGFDVRLLLKHLGQWATEKGYQGTIHYVFAQLPKQGNELDRIFTQCLRDAETRERFKLNGMWTKGLMRDVVQLQAADILAYELNKRAVNQYGMGAKRVRKSLDLFRYDPSKLAPLYIGKKEILGLFQKTGYQPEPANAQTHSNPTAR